MDNITTPEKKQNKRLITVAIILAILIICMIVAVLLIFTKHLPLIRSRADSKGDYSVKELEPDAIPYDDDSENDDKMTKPEGGGAVSISYTKDVKVSLSDNKLNCYFANPRKSGQDIVIEIVSHGTTIASSGRIVPGKMINELKLKANVKLKEGIYDGKYIISYYDSDTAEKAILNTEVPIKITVSK